MVDVMIHGYARRSTAGQRDDLQVQALEAAGAETIWSEVASGAATMRPVSMIEVGCAGSSKSAAVAANGIP